ncbi:MAG: hypothetical protein JWP63_5142 [Candidatus Solibacter sp.]|nr:hypothetical protein [Candidatus Solibacter sp.]
MNSMKAQLLTATLLTASFSGAMSAADPQLLNLVMPDAKVLAGVNVEQAKGTQFGQFILNQLQTHDSDMQKLVTLTGFDPRRDVRELLVASDGTPQTKVGLALATGNFDVAKISALGALHGVVTEQYNGVTILEDPKSQEHGIAFLNSTIVVAGDIASVKGAIDRQKTPQPLPASVIVKVNQWSNSQDAWGVATVPPASLVPPAKAGNANPMAGAFQNVQQAAGGVKFGAQVVFTGEATCDTAQNASTLGDVIKLLINIAQMQTGADPTAAALVKSVTVTASGNVVKISANLPEDVFQTLLTSPKAAQRAPRSLHKQ